MLADSVETVLREELAHGDAMLGTIEPILRHLVASDDHSVFGDEIIARVRGMIADLAGQLLDEVAKAQGNEAVAQKAPEQAEALSLALAGAPNMLTHVHALALEWQLTERLQARHSLDPVLSPLLQALIASTEPNVAGLAMNMLASQARFCQSQRRMKLPLGELPADLMHFALQSLRSVATNVPAETVAGAEAAIRGRYDESCSRIGLISRLVVGMGAGAIAALSITHAGSAIFLSALALASGQPRELAVLSTNESQLARLALALRAAGVKSQGVEELFLSLHPDVALPDGFERLGADRAAAILAVSGGLAGG
mgnify:CR=1 FL=1